MSTSPVGISESMVREKVASVADAVDLSALKSSESTSREQIANDPVSTVRPAVVLVRTPDSSGSGCVVHADGWVITNHHVVRNAPWDPDTGMQVVRVYFGQNTPAGFALVQQPVWARVFKTSRRTDLALLRCESLPAGLNQVPALALAAARPVEGTECYAIGMPAASVMWTVRKGTIAGHGRFPNAIENRLRLGAGESVDEQQRKSLLRQLAPDGDYGVTISTCGINPGDSGGPLTDVSGKLVAITYAVPATVAHKQFGYHVALEEIREFLSDLPPRGPMVEPPSSLPKSTTCKIHWNRRKRGAIDFVLIQREDDPMVGFYFDVDNEVVDSITDQEASQLSETDFWKFFGIDWCVTWDPEPTYYFDRDQDGKYDEVYIVSGGVGDEICRFKRQHRSWIVQRGEAGFLDSENMFDRGDAQSTFESQRHQVLPSILRR